MIEINTIKQLENLHDENTIKYTGKNHKEFFKALLKTVREVILEHFPEQESVDDIRKSLKKNKTLKILDCQFFGFIRRKYRIIYSNRLYEMIKDNTSITIIGGPLSPIYSSGNKDIKQLLERNRELARKQRLHQIIVGATIALMPLQFPPYILKKILNFAYPARKTINKNVIKILSPQYRINLIQNIIGNRYKTRYLERPETVEHENDGDYVTVITTVTTVTKVRLKRN